MKVWQDACQYLYMPRLVNDQILRRTVEEAVKSTDFFAFASGIRDDRFEGFAFGKSSTVFLDENSVLISRDAALRYQAKLEQEAREKSEEERKRVDPMKTTAMGPIRTNRVTTRTQIQVLELVK